MAATRSDWLHKLTTLLADRHPVIALEYLKINNMSASAKGMVSMSRFSPGTNGKVMAGLNRGILNAAWGQFRKQLDDKLAARGSQLVLVSPAH